MFTIPIIIAISIACAYILSKYIITRVRHLPRNVVVVVRIIIWIFVGIFTILSILNALGLIAALNIAGFTIGVLAVAFSGLVQSLVQGLIVLLESKFEIGDTINIEGVEAKTGVVKSIGMRITTLVNDKGDTIEIPNSQIYVSTVINLSKEKR